MNRRDFVVASSAALFVSCSPPAPASEPIRVFALDDVEWWAGRSLEECLAAARELCGQDCYSEPGDMGEVSGEAMQKMMFHDEDGTVRPFAQELQRRIAAGEQFPQHFASTEW